MHYDFFFNKLELNILSREISLIYICCKENYAKIYKLHH